MKKLKFYSAIRVDRNDVGLALRNGYTDGKYNYFYAGYRDWWCIDPASGLLLVRAETKEKLAKELIAKAETIEQAKATKHYESSVETFKKLCLYGGQCTLKQITTK